jgi:hypothetical protein
VTSLEVADLGGDNDRVGDWLSLRNTAATFFFEHDIVGPIARNVIADYHDTQDEQVIMEQMRGLVAFYGSDLERSKDNSKQQLIGKFLMNQAKFIVEAVRRRALDMPVAKDFMEDRSATEESKEIEHMEEIIWTNYDIEAGDIKDLQPLLVDRPPSVDEFMANVVAVEPMQRFIVYMRLLTPASIVEETASVSFGTSHIALRTADF